MQRPEGGYQNLPSLKKVGLQRNEVEALASANALRVFADNRYQARWALMNESNDLPLLSVAEGKSHSDLNDKQDAFRFSPGEFENLLEDYASTGLSLELHPITLLDKADKLGVFVRANQL